MEILHLKDLGDPKSIITNAVVLMLGVSNFNSNVPQGVIADGHTHTHRQPQYNSFAAASQLN